MKTTSMGFPQLIPCAIWVSRMVSLLIHNCRLLDERGMGRPSAILVNEGVISRIGPIDPCVRAERVLDAQGRIAAPGFLDIHIQGAGGADVLDATPEALQTISRACAKFGVTGFLATTIHKPGQENRHLKIAADCCGRDLGGARLLGIHLEGPFISRQKRGMIQPDCIADPAATTLDEIRQLTDGWLKMMTIAPELPGSLDVIRTLVGHGAVAALGHTSATYEETVVGFDAGITHVTHLFNAMPSMHHREPGPIPAVFERTGVSVQVITDGVHIHPAMLRLAFDRLGPERFIAITDAMLAAGLPDGKYIYNGIEYESKNGTARYRDGTLIGTSLGLNQMVARLIGITGCSLATAVKTVTENPARVLGLERHKGRIQVGYDADIVLVDEDLSVYATIVGGRVVYAPSMQTSARQP
jgi:N-acetylglucosamine-6-phosphate deacetylase